MGLANVLGQLCAYDCCVCYYQVSWNEYCRFHFSWNARELFPGSLWLVHDIDLH